MKDSGVPWIGKIPVNWKTIRLKYISKLINGFAFKSQDLKVDGYYKVVRIGDLNNNKINLEDCLGVDVVDNYRDYKVCMGDALVALSGATVGKVAFADNNIECYINQRVGIIRSFWSRLIFHIFSVDKFIENLKSCLNDSAQPNLSIEDIGRISIPIYDKTTIKKIVRYLDDKCENIDTIIAKEQSVIEKLQEYKESIINEAVTKGVDIQVEFKPSGYDFIGDIPKSWKLLKVRYLGLLQNGISKSGNYFGHGMPFISYKDVYSSFVIPNQLDGLIESTKEEQEKYSVQSGDIFFTRTSETIDEIGISSVCKKTILYAIFSGFLIRLRLINNIVSPDWAKYYFRSNHLRAYFVKEMNLVTRASLSQELLKSLPVLIPSQEEQNKIIKYLDEKCNTIDSIILKKQALIDKLTEYKKSLIYEVVTGKKEVPHV